MFIIFKKIRQARAQVDVVRVRYSHALQMRRSNSFIMRNFIRKYFNKSDQRTNVIKKNIVISFIYKMLSIALSLAIVPVTVNYVNGEQYGIWLTISSIVAWIGYFDLGLGHGLRNKYAVAKARGNVKLIKQLISTTYILFVAIFAIIFLVFSIANRYIDWCSFLKITQLDNSALRTIMFALVGFFCLNMVFKILNSLLLADQRTGYASGITVIEQFCSLLIILIISNTLEANLFNLVFTYSCVPCFVLLALSLYHFLSKNGFFRQYRPSLKLVNPSLCSGLLTLGGKFFVIQVSLVFIFQSVNIILSRNCGQLAVTQYNLSYKYFQILYMISVILMTPYWSAFTDAYAKKDFEWMKKTYTRILRISLLFIPAYIVMLLLAPLYFELWIGKQVEIPFFLNVTMGIYILAQTYCGVQMFIINGIGKVLIQLIVYVSFAILSIPLMSFLSFEYGYQGILFVLILVYLVQAVFGNLQINKIISQTAKGIWVK